MKILGIETSCDDTAISIVESADVTQFEVLGNTSFSQAKLHSEYGGVFPNLAKREHGKNLVPLLRACLSEAEMNVANKIPLSDEQKEKLENILSRESELLPLFVEFIENTEKPDIDAIAVTHGPGLEPTLWVGVNFAKALSYIWDIKLIPINHMEGHVLSALYQNEKIDSSKTPILSLLISGGHTELVLMDPWLEYRLIGKTLDDAVGEAYDKVARMMGLPYPGGPHISKYAEEGRKRGGEKKYTLPRPMMHHDNCNFSFSGLKTAVLREISDDIDKEKMSEEFENAVTEVLMSKTKKAIDETSPKVLVVGGGVSANKHIREEMKKLAEQEGLEFYIPDTSLTGDNAVMIALAGHYRALKGEYSDDFVANGNLALYR